VLPEGETVSDEALTMPVARLLKRLRLGRAVESVKLRLVHTRVLDVPVTFCVNMKNDPIQRNHRRGQFYEIKELAALRAIFPQGGVFVDIGANVGNHSLFAALFLKAAKVIPFEPNPLAYDLLIQNVLVNRLAAVVDLSRLGVGVGAERQSGFGMQRRERNLGGAKMLAGEGDLDVHSGDDLLDGLNPDVIKIDVEGMEMQVLSGLAKTIERSRPVMMVEVDNSVEGAFSDWVEAQGYSWISIQQRYRLNKNHLIADKARVEDLKAAYSASPTATSDELEHQEA
jgi:FkbM family methyltransferase